MSAVVGGEAAAVTSVGWKNIMFGHFSGLHCQMTKQFSNEFDTLHSWGSSPRLGGAQYSALQAVEHLSEGFWARPREFSGVLEEARQKYGVTG